MSPNDANSTRGLLAGLCANECSAFGGCDWLRRALPTELVLVTLRNDPAAHEVVRVCMCMYVCVCVYVCVRVCVCVETVCSRWETVRGRVCV